MAALGGRAEPSVLAVASAKPADVVERLLAPALEEGLLVQSSVHGGVRFRHDRIREAILAEVDAKQLRTMQLTLARRLVGVRLIVRRRRRAVPTGNRRGRRPGRAVSAGGAAAARAEQAARGRYAQVETLLTGALRLADATIRLR